MELNYFFVDIIARHTVNALQGKDYHFGRVKTNPNLGKNSKNGINHCLPTMQIQHVNNKGKDSWCPFSVDLPRKAKIPTGYPLIPPLPSTPTRSERERAKEHAQFRRPPAAAATGQGMADNLESTRFPLTRVRFESDLSMSSRLPAHLAAAVGGSELRDSELHVFFPIKQSLQLDAMLA